MSAECPEMFLHSRDFLKTCKPVAEALETVDADDEDRVETEVNVVDFEELLEEWPTLPQLWNRKVVSANLELQQCILLDP